MKKEDGMKSIQKLGILSVAYFLCIFYAIMGLFNGIVMALQVSSSTLSASMDPTILEPLSGLGWWLVLIFPIVFALIGFFAGIIVSLLYNLISKYTGGIRVKLE